MKMILKQDNSFREKGVSLFLTMTILAIMSAVVLGLTAISIKGIKIVVGLENSVFSFYAANTGIEESLYELRRLNEDGIVFGAIGDADYDTFVESSTTTTGIISTGTYRGTKRIISTTTGIISTGTYRGTKRIIRVTY